MGLFFRLVAAAAAMKALGYTQLLPVAAVPLRDLLGLAVWAAGVGGNQVEWRGLRFLLLSDGRIKPL